MLLGKNGENVRDLIDSFRKNGYLPIDQIQVRQLDSEKKYLVVEGNRRVACLKWLQGRYIDEEYDLGNLDPGIFDKVPVVYYENADDAHHLILMGLKHISGNKKWPSINQAEFVRTLYIKHKMSRDDICDAIAIRPREFNRILNTLALIEKYKNSDYRDQFKSDQYSMFNEVIRSKNLRDWLNWDYYEYKLSGTSTNLERLFSWISTDEELFEEEEEKDDFEVKIKLEPVITRSSQIKELSKLVTDENALNNLDTTRNLTEATLTSDVLGKDKVKNAISIIGQEINTIFNISHHISDSDRADIEEQTNKLTGILELQKTQKLTIGSKKSYIFEKPTSHFSSLKLKNFKRIIEVEFSNLAQINIIAGINNAGKTTFLEAVSLLTALNSSREIVNLTRQRAKLITNKIEMPWFIDQISTCLLTARFNDTDISVNIQLEEDNSIDDQTYYLKTVTSKSQVGKEKLSSHTHFFEKYPQRTEGNLKSLCSSVFSSPFTGLDPELLKNCHEKSVRLGSKELIIDFIRQYIDTGVRNIELVTEGRFLVIHDNFNHSPDLSQFGEGMQRAFKIGLLFAGAQNGVVLIDELENAIHATLLPKLVKLIHDLSIKFNVQVFLTSHSKECIDAFVTNKDVPKDQISGYTLIEEEEKIECQYFSGERLEKLNELIDFDLRGGNKS